MITYELAIRKRTWSLVQSEGVTFSAGLRQAWADPVVKERHFPTPLALHTVAKRAASIHDEDGKGKGDGKGSTGHRRMAPPAGWLESGKGGESICGMCPTKTPLHESFEVPPLVSPSLPLRRVQPTRRRHPSLRRFGR